MIFKITFGIDNSSYVQDFMLIGFRWTYNAGRIEWFQFHLLGFRFYFNFEDLLGRQ